MLVVTRRQDEAFTMILPDGSRIRVEYLGPHGLQVRFGITAPKTVKILRDEILPENLEYAKRGAAQ